MRICHRVRLHKSFLTGFTYRPVPFVGLAFAAKNVQRVIEVRVLDMDLVWVDSNDRAYINKIIGKLDYRSNFLPYLS